jgi:hypothetical protein
MVCDSVWVYALYDQFFKIKGDVTQAKEKLKKTI